MSAMRVALALLPRRRQLRWLVRAVRILELRSAAVLDGTYEGDAEAGAAAVDVARAVLVVSPIAVWRKV